MDGTARLQAVEQAKRSYIRATGQRNECCGDAGDDARVVQLSLLLLLVHDAGGRGIARGGRPRGPSGGGESEKKKKRKGNEELKMQVGRPEAESQKDGRVTRYERWRWRWRLRMELIPDYVTWVS